MKSQYLVPPSRLASLQESIRKVNRKATKLGCPTVSFEVLAHEDHPALDERGQTIPGHFIVKARVEVTGSAPTVGGFTFVATLDHGNEAGTVIRAVPGLGVEIPKAFREASSLICEHCNSKRARNETFLLVNEAGEFKQVGRNCLRDFLGGIDPHAIVAHAELLLGMQESLEAEESYAGGSRDRRFSLRQYLEFVAAAIRRDGWTSRSASTETRPATANTALGVMFSEKQQREACKAAGYFPNEADVATVDAAMAYAEANLWSVDPDSLNDYLNNLRIVSKQESIDFKSAGLAASLIAMVKREQEKKVVSENSNYIGEVGKRIDLTLKVVSHKDIVGDYGITVLYKMVDPDGNVVTWFSSKNHSLEDDQEIKAKATVKKHEEFRGVKQTVVTRLKVV